VLYILLSNYLILDMVYVTFQGYHFGVFEGIVYKVPVSVTSVSKTWDYPELERADFTRPSFQYSWLNSDFFSSL